MVERDLLGQLLGLLGHGLQFMEQNLGIEFAQNLVPELGDCRGGGDHLVLQLLEELSQSPGPVKPFRVDLDFLAAIGRDDVVHGPDVGDWVDPDCLT